MMYLFVTVVAIFYLSTFSISDAQNLTSPHCNTPNGTAGNCVVIRQCIPLLNQLQEQPLRPQTVDYLQRSQCGFEGHNPRVCCPDESNPIKSSTEVPNTTLENVDNNDPIISLLNTPLLPSECGRDSKARDMEAVHTDLDEFPWIAQLGYKDGNITTFDCVGALINKRYVLTAAHCLKNTVGKKLLFARLGEYDANSSKDCVKRDDVNICSDDPITVGFEEIIPHELFEPILRNYDYDIGLIRLSKDIVLTDYVKPICLPRSSMVNERLYIAGWGTTLEGSPSHVKLKVSIPLVDKDYCARIYKQFYKISLSFEMICAGGEGGKNACRGDSGTPLMSFQTLPNGDKIWSAMGIVFMGSRKCGEAGWPSVSNKVYDFIPWIIRNSTSPHCNTPNGTAGNCVAIRQCIPLLNRLQEKPLRPETVNYLKQSQCGFEGQDPRVCCQVECIRRKSSTEVPNTTLENIDNNDPIISLLNTPLLPSECGRDSKVRDLEAIDTDIDEFPWMALLGYKDGSKLTFDCAGTLITKRYVLTVAHCLKYTRNKKLSYVRLGEYDLNSSKDCVKRDDEYICSDDPITVEIEEIIPHELFAGPFRNFEYDIGLLRLAKDIVLTDYVKPICLPRSSMVNERLYIAGWGATLEGSPSHVKLKVSIPLVDKDYCVNVYKEKVNVSLSFEQICAGGRIERDACQGDSGGPLMSFQNLPNGDKIWTANGIISFGYRYCGSIGWPTVSNKVYDFIPWIISKIKP